MSGRRTRTQPAREPTPKRRRSIQRGDSRSSSNGESSTDVRTIQQQRPPSSTDVQTTQQQKPPSPTTSSAGSRVAPSNPMPTRLTLPARPVREQTDPLDQIAPLSPRSIRRMISHVGELQVAPDSPVSDFICPICFDILKEPFITPCGHSFCYDCISSNLKQYSRCPSCNEPTTNDDSLIPNVTLSEAIYKYRKQQGAEHLHERESIEVLYEIGKVMEKSEDNASVAKLKLQRDILLVEPNKSSEHKKMEQYSIEAKQQAHERLSAENEQLKVSLKKANFDMEQAIKSYRAERRKFKNHHSVNTGSANQTIVDSNIEHWMKAAKLSLINDEIARSQVKLISHSRTAEHLVDSSHDSIAVDNINCGTMEHFDLKSEHDPSENSPYDGRNLEKLLEKYHEKLVKTLPFKDACFLASLQTAGLFFGDLKEKVQAKETSAEMTAYFLDHGINNDSESFEKLLTVMEKFNHNPVKHLAKDIRKQCCIERGSLLSSNTCKSDHDSTIHHGDQTHGFGGMIEEEVKKLKGDYHKYKQLLKTTRHGIKINKIEIQLESEASIMKIHEKYNAAYKLLREKEAAAVNEVKTIEEVFMQQLAKQTKLRRLIEKELVACGEKIVTIEKTRQSLSNAGLSARSADELMKQPTAVDAEYEACDVNQIIGCRKRLRIVKGKDEWII